MKTTRNTVQKQLIFSAVSELCNHPTAEQVYRQVIKKYPNISKATVYRNLSQMAEAGELLNIGNHDGSTRYDHNLHGHSHFVCSKCNKIHDIDDDLSSLIKKLNSKGDFEITSCNISFTGFCQDCKGS